MKQTIPFVFPPLLIALLALNLLTLSAQTIEQPLPTPPMREFIGINGDFLFKPDLYRPICHLFRMYHPAPWDLDKDTSVLPAFPQAKNGVNWADFYQTLKKSGFSVDATVQIDAIKPPAWKDLAKDGQAYGEALAQAFGPSGKNLIASVEIGNEPASWSDQEYRKIFEAMGKGLREGDPKLKIVTAAASAGKPDQFSKKVSTFQGLEAYYDVLNIHTYAFTAGWPTWKRTFPEDPLAKNYLSVIQEMIKYRDTQAPGKEIWVTEFGYDASSQPPKDPKFVGATDLEQAQWLVRSLLLFSSMGIQRAYLYFYNDQDVNSLHAASGLTRNLQPKPSYHAVAHLDRTLGNYHFSKVITRTPNLCVFEYLNPEQDKKPIWVAWSPTGTQKESRQHLALPGTVKKAERMPLQGGDPEQIAVSQDGAGVDLPISESPLYLWVTE